MKDDGAASKKWIIEKEDRYFLFEKEVTSDERRERKNSNEEVKQKKQFKYVLK